MKRCFLFLLLCFIALYTKEGVDNYLEYTQKQDITLTCLSDIADQVTAIPLKTGNRALLSGAKDFKRHDGHLFLINKKQLLHFDMQGNFQNAITCNNPLSNDRVRVKDYVIDPIARQLIVLDEDAMLHYYTFEGGKLGSMPFPRQMQPQKIGKLAFHQGDVWTTIDRINRNAKGEWCLEQWLYRFDTAFTIVEARKLEMTDLGRMAINYVLNPEPAVTDERLYIQSAAPNPDYLPEDTLYLLSRNKLQIPEGFDEILPLRIGARFLISCEFNPGNPTDNYLFCHDKKKHRSYTLKTGLTDNFYNTGQVPDLQAMDLNSQTFCFLRSGKSLQEAFPAYGEDETGAVLFIVRLKG